MSVTDHPNSIWHRYRTPTVAEIGTYLQNFFCSYSSLLLELLMSLCMAWITGAVARSRAFFGQGTGAILLDQVGCTGTEARLVDCTSNPLGVHDCSHFEDAGVTCQSMSHS